MIGTISQKTLEKRIKRFKDEPSFLKFIRQQSEENKKNIFKLFPENRFVIKYLDDRAKADAGKDKKADGSQSIQILSDKDYENAAKDIEELIKKSPLNTPFLNNVNNRRFYEPNISYFSKRPKMDSENENDAKFLFRMINTHLTRKSSTYTKEEIEKKLASVTKKHGGKKRQFEADLRTNLALHNWILARSKTLTKNEKNELFIEAMKDLCKAMYIGGFSYFNVSSFGLIHNEYLNNYKLLLEDKQKQIMKNSMLYDFLPVLRNQFGGIELLKKSSTFLNSRLIDLFETHSLDFKLKKIYTADFKKALSYYLHNKPDKMVNGIHSKVYVFLYLDLLIYLSCIYKMELPGMLSEYISLSNIMEKDYDISLRGHAIEIRQLLFEFYRASSRIEPEPGDDVKTLETETKPKAASSPFDLLCKLMAACNKTIYEIRKKSNVDRYIEVKYYELYPLFRYYDALVYYIPNNEIDKDIKVFTINFLRDALFFKQQAIARHKEDRVVNVIQKMMDVIKASYKRRVKEYKASMIKNEEPDYAVSEKEEEE